MGNIKLFDDEIHAQVRGKQIVLEQLSKEDKHLSGVESGGRSYNTMMMFEKMLERNLDRWRDELAAIDDIEKQDMYYRSVIYPHISYLENRIELRHKRHRHSSIYVGHSADVDENTVYDENDIAYIAEEIDLDNEIFSRYHNTLHELVTDPALCLIIKGLTDEQRTIIHQNAVLGYSTMQISVIKGTTDRNVRKTKDTALTHIRGQYFPIVMFKYKIQTQKKYRWLFVRGVSTTFWERLFAATIGEDYTDYYPEYVITEETKKDTLRYIEYHNTRVFDFVEITRDYRAQEQRDRDWIAGWRDKKRRRKELAKKKIILQKQIDDSKILDDDNSYEKGVTDDYAQNISEQ